LHPFIIRQRLRLRLQSLSQFAMLAPTPSQFGHAVQVRSLRQLILGSFFVALVPLIALLWQSQRDFDSMSQETASNTTFFVFMTSELRELEALGDDVERLVRSYQVFPKNQMQEIADSAIEGYSNKLEFLCDQFSDITECRDLNLTLSQLSDYPSFSDNLLLDAQLASLRQSQGVLRRQVQQLINQKIVSQQTFLEEIQNRQGWSTFVLVLLSLGLTILAAQLIIKPVKKLKTIIRAIANNDSKLPLQTREGPRELVAVERDLYWLNDRLQQLEKVRTALLRHASHELKTPMASIKEGCEILEQGMVGELTSQQSEVVSLLLASTDRLNLLIVKLLDYNALLQQAEPTFEKIDLHLLVNECSNQYPLLLNQNKQKIVIRIEPLHSVVSDPELLRRALDNLVSNAIAHGNIDSEITIQASDIGNNTLIDVMNMGTPITLAARGEIFEPFKRGQKTRNDRVIGAGLGLSIVSDCARLLGGDVTIIDHNKADICFRIRLPRREYNEKQ
jgi:two-component system sensor histidine kinase GlrK